MLELNTASIKKIGNNSIIKIPKNKDYAGYRFIIPNRFIKSTGTFTKVITLPWETKIKIKKDDDTQIITLGDLR